MLTEKEHREREYGKGYWKVFVMIFVYLLVFVPMVWHFFHSRFQRKAIRQKHSFASGVITRLVFRSGKGRNFYWTCAEYRVNGVPFTCRGKAFRTLKPDQRDSLVGLKLPVIYERARPSNSKLLYSEAQFNRFNLAFPDSLGWTISYFLE